MFYVLQKPHYQVLAGKSNKYINTILYSNRLNIRLLVHVRGITPICHIFSHIPPPRYDMNLGLGSQNEENNIFSRLMSESDYYLFQNKHQSLNPLIATVKLAAVGCSIKSYHQFSSFHEKVKTMPNSAPPSLAGEKTQPWQSLQYSHAAIARFPCFSSGAKINLPT